ncbi:MAG: hypothetical protein EP305_04285 [Bacteroidetes bacterium]|nr:MAG: hypothetical protein EP305_04285 [Bacteroidota bacterium]
MKTKIRITRKNKFLTQSQIFNLLDDFINDAYCGKRTRKDGKRINSSTIVNYVHLRNILQEFCDSHSFEFKIYLESNLTYQEKTVAFRYYRNFYLMYTKFMYEDKLYFDNYVGLLIRGLRCFFNYLEVERRISIGTYHKSFFVPREEIPIIALSVDQLKYLIYNESFNTLVKSKKLEEIRDVFVFGCTVALRVSDLLQLTVQNLFIQDDVYYLRVKSQKTSTKTSIKLPDYAIRIVQKYYGDHATLLPAMTAQWFNSKLKNLAKLIPNDHDIVKVRERRGKQVVIYKDPINKVHFKFSDHITSHTMRRTAITTMLNLGMPEHIVRKISGHAANSREFYRYVELSQFLIDQESDKVFDKIRKYKNPGKRSQNNYTID